ncbi:MAG: hypothetical protein JNM70_07320 [Anaerolineae bacterium]|nr:hypothetical protein [Anaerolineae bacterium]
MISRDTRITDLTVDELLMLIREAVREELRQRGEASTGEQTALLELDPLHVGPWPEGLKLLSREEY